MKRDSVLIDKRRKFIDDYLINNNNKSMKENVLTLSYDILFISQSTIWKDIYATRIINNPWSRI